MKFKVFSSRTRRGLEEEVNQWLQTHPVSPDSMRFAYSAIPHDDDTSEITEHVLVIFYVPMMSI